MMYFLTNKMDKKYDIVVVGAGAAGVVAACIAAEHSASVALIQKEATIISQGNCASAIIKSRSTEAGIAKWIHHTNSLCNWRCDTKQLRVMSSQVSTAPETLVEDSSAVATTLSITRVFRWDAVSLSE